MKIIFTLFIFRLSTFGFDWFVDDPSTVDSLQQETYTLIDEDPKRALIFADSSILLARKEGYKFGEANGYFIIGYIYWQDQNLNKAFYFYLKSAKILESLEKPDSESAELYTSVLLNSGSILRQNFRYEDAISFYDRGLAAAEQWDLQKQRQKLLYNKASVLQDMGDYYEAYELCQESMSIANNFGLNSLSIKCQNLLGLIYVDLEALDKARNSFLSILNTQHSSEYDQARALHNMAITYKTGNLDSCRFYLEKALELKKRLNQPEMQYSTYFELTELEMGQGNYDEAKHWASQAVDIYPGLKKHPDFYEIFYLLTKMNIDDPGKHDYYLTKYHDESLLFNERQQEIIRQLKGFQTDLIQAGFMVEQKAEAFQGRINLIMKLTSFLVVIIGITSLIIFKIRERHIKQGRERMIREILYGDDLT